MLDRDADLVINKVHCNSPRPRRGRTENPVGRDIAVAVVVEDHQVGARVVVGRVDLFVHGIDGYAANEIDAGFDSRYYSARVGHAAGSEIPVIRPQAELVFIRHCNDVRIRINCDVGKHGIRILNGTEGSNIAADLGEKQQGSRTAQKRSQERLLESDVHLGFLGLPRKFETPVPGMSS
jgi:hypothetical protein